MRPVGEFEKNSKATAEKSTRAAEQSYSAAARNMRDYSLRMIEMAQVNADAAFELARDLATAKGPSDLAAVWTAYSGRQFQMLTEQTKELAALGQKMAGESAEPIARTVKQAVDKAS
jgi:hypothetical protein